MIIVVQLAQASDIYLEEPLLDEGREMAIKNIL